MRSAAGLAALALLAGCGGKAADPAPRALDLGLSPPSATFPALRVATRAVPPFDSAQMYYRLAWRNPAELAEYAHSQWAAPPSELLRKQVLRSAGEGVGKCLLELEVQEFTQVFTSKETSEARIEARVALTNGQLRLASRGVAIVEPGAGSEASSGARAMARAADRALGELAAWVAAQPSCR
jgi:cholesterol transport system auxiliary component